MPDPKELLACTLTYRAAERRSVALEAKFRDAKSALRTWFDVLMHEAHEAFAAPLEDVPKCTYLHPVDVDTTEPGIVDERESGHIMRCTPDMPRVVYARNALPAPPVAPPSPLVCEPGRAAEAAQKCLEKSMRGAERKAATAVRREEKLREQREARLRETPEDRAERLEASRRKRAEREERGRDAVDAAPIAEEAPMTPPPRSLSAVEEESLLVEDVSLGAVLAPVTKRRRKGKAQYFSHPVPHHRHLLGLQMAEPSVCLLAALLQGTRSEQMEIIQGPPGTGKTRELVRRVRHATGRVFLCAPTNVGAVNLYTRCVADGLEAEAALALSPDRVPPGTVVLSNDTSRRVVCATISARSGPILIGQRFDNVFVDEAAQCMEAWMWTLFRKEVGRVVLAGDVKQLPACVSESGKQLKHERSLMERLVVDLEYANTVTLHVQNRMAPELLALPNRLFYDSALLSGEHAPRVGRVEIRTLHDATEEVAGTSFRNVAEAREAARIAQEHDCVIITPYAGQVQLLLSHGTSREVHTIDSFQGREADTVVLSLVRDGRNGFGFWSDTRRLAVALTRARTHLVVLASRAHEWPPDGPLGQLVAAA